MVLDSSYCGAYAHAYAREYARTGNHTKSHAYAHAYARAVARTDQWAVDTRYDTSATVSTGLPAVREGDASTEAPAPTE